METLGQLLPETPRSWKAKPRGRERGGAVTLLTLQLLFKERSQMNKVSLASNGNRNGRDKCTEREMEWLNQRSRSHL